DTRKTGFSVHLGQPPTDGRRSSRSRGRPTPRLLLPVCSRRGEPGAPSGVGGAGHNSCTGG
ncbi:hypothetical protein, partial [Acinetobacter baumannii]|uniref:hypothetical protein n=1 Tax=Acinetobacter baumannii TaxID=470 RepID=UPI001C0A2541